MSVVNNLRLRSSVGIVVKPEQVEFFLANIRESVLLKMRFFDLVSLLQKFDGKTPLVEIAKSYGNIDIQQLEKLALFLKSRYVLIEQDQPYPIELVSQHYRLLNMLEEYFHTTSEVIKAFVKLQNATVMIIGLGAVGSYIATYLAKAQVGNLILVDNDCIDESNLHRQYYFDDQIGKKKTQALKAELQACNNQINVQIIEKFLIKDFFEQTVLPSKLNLIINCSDEPSVDETSRIIATYAMDKSIPHIIGGGYNLHLTLIGQTIIPYQTACFECFNVFLRRINDEDLKNVKKLHRENRKLGSFSPLSGIAASLASLDAFKVIIEQFDKLNQANKRIEFNMCETKFTVMDIPKNPECRWCGKNG